jgi:molybdate transport system substrate-binding protein
MRSSVRFLVAAVAGLLLSGGAGAATIEVLSAGAVEPGLLPAAEAFRRETGHEAVLDDLAKLRRVDGDARVPIGKVGVGATVREGAPQPDLRTVEALKRAVLGAETVVYNRASTGLYLEKLFERLGVAEAIAARSVRYPDGASVLEHVARGTGREIGFGAITEIMLFRDKGLRLVGPLPAEVQNYTTYAAAPAAGAANAEAARAFVRFLGGPAGRAIFAAHGVE